MKLEDFFNFLADDDIRLQGSRIGIESILYEYIHRDKSAEQIVERFPSLTLAQIYATILYYLTNRQQVEAYLLNWLNFSEMMREQQERNPSPAVMKIRDLKAEHSVFANK